MPARVQTALTDPLRRIESVIQLQLGTDVVQVVLAVIVIFTAGLNVSTALLTACCQLLEVKVLRCAYPSSGAPAPASCGGAISINLVAGKFAGQRKLAVRLIE